MKLLPLNSAYPVCGGAQRKTVEAHMAEGEALQ